MNLASPSGPPSRFKTPIVISSPNAEGLSLGAARNVDPGCGSAANAAFSCQSGKHAVPFHIPMWRLADPTAMAAPSLYPSLQSVQRKKKKSSSCHGFSPPTGAAPQKNRLCRREYGVLNRVSLCYDLSRGRKNGWSVRRECDDTGFLLFFFFFFIPSP